MSVILGLVVFVVAGVAWVGQAIACFAPATAARLGLAEPPDEVDPAFDADGRGEASWDAMTLWVLPLAGLLIVMDSRAWPYFGLVGAGMFVYFAGRGIASRIQMQRRGIRIGTRANVRAAYLALSIWLLLGAVMIVAASLELG